MRWWRGGLEGADERKDVPGNVFTPTVGCTCGGGTPSALRGDAAGGRLYIGEGDSGLRGLDVAVKSGGKDQFKGWLKIV